MQAAESLGDGTVGEGGAGAVLLTGVWEFVFGLLVKAS